MVPGFHGLDLIIVLIIACLIFGPREFVSTLLKVLVGILRFIAALIFGPKAIHKLVKIWKVFLKHLL